MQTQPGSEQENNVWVQGAGATAERARVKRFANVSLISPAIVARTMWNGPGYMLPIPLSTVKRPVVAEVTWKDGVFMEKHYCGSATKGWCGLRVWDSPTLEPLTERDRQTMKEIELQEKVAAGDALPPEITLQQMMPWRGSANTVSASSRVIPGPGWTWDELQRWAAVNRIRLPGGKDLAANIAEGRERAQDLRRRGAPVRAIPAVKGAGERLSA